MRLADEIKYRITAGGPPSSKGPGSGHYQHVHKVLKISGWKEGNIDEKGIQNFRWKSDTYPIPAHGYVHVDTKTGEWVHSPDFKKIYKGTHEDAEQHFIPSTPKILATHAEFTPDEKKAIKLYSGQQAEEVNEYLLKGKNDNSKFNKTIQDLDSAISKGKVNFDMTVYRGIYGNYGDELIKMRKGQSFPAMTYQSTSRELGTAEDFANEHGETDSGVVLFIDLKKGSNAIEMSKAIKRGEMGEMEDELLLPRTTNYKIRSVNRANRVLHVEVT